MKTGKKIFLFLLVVQPPNTKLTFPFFMRRVEDDDDAYFKNAADHQPFLPIDKCLSEPTILLNAGKACDASWQV